MKDSRSYAMSMDYGVELTDPAKHLIILLDEGRQSYQRDSLPADEYALEMTQRDAAIARCALILSHGMLKGSLHRTDESFALVERALEWLYRA